ncbi:MAG: FAD-binding oxidoreductase [Deltaproteobacteria bacterium]|nr:FAD-binding oxidoreductase [Deltaproteobacteria bacterium]
MDDRLVQEAEQILGAAHLLAGADAAPYAVDGMVPRAVAFPESVEEVAALLGVAHRLGAAVIPWGAGTRQDLGRPPKRADLILGLRRLNRVLEHEPGDLTASVQAGIALGALQEALGARGQWLALDPPRGHQATLGGLAATNVAGPRRFRYGTLRDMVIGIRVVGADGTVTKGGGKVVKNVTGYDMNKLYVGSLGTLAVIVELNVRLHPVPAVRAAVAGTFRSPDEAWGATRAILHSPLQPVSLVLMGEPTEHGGVRGSAAGGAPAGIGSGPVAEDAGPWVLLVGIEGFPEVVAGQRQPLHDLCLRAGARSLTALEGEELVAAESAMGTLWDLPSAPCWARCRLSTVPARVPKLCEVAAGLGAEHGLRARMVSFIGNGITHVLLMTDAGGTVGEDRVIAAAEGLKAWAAGEQAAYVMEAAPVALRRRVDPWEAPRGDFRLMAGLKAAFDPEGILNPGRFIGGL